MTATKSKFPDLYKLLLAAVEHGQSYWDSYYGTTENVLESFLEEDRTKKLLERVTNGEEIHAQ